VKVNYEGKLMDGTVFDSSYKRGQPIEFPLNGVIPCWTEGVQKMKVGGEATLVCPPSIAYGERGAPGAIPPNAALVFKVELLGVTPGAPAPAPAGK
jgi:FKBP-type peptidyl-prolyl cis-trans isomerase FkpA